MPIEPDAAALAAGVNRTGALLAADTTPPIASVTVERDHYAARVRADLQLAAREQCSLAALVDWAETFTDPTVRALRHTEPTPFTSVSVHTAESSLDVRVWTHPDEDELTVLWHAVGHNPPEVGERVTVSIDALRAAAASCQDGATASDQAEADGAADEAAVEAGS